MDIEIITTLNEINRVFYEHFAQSFTDSRIPKEPGLERIVIQIQPEQRILDLGCGQGRIAFLVPESSEYVGIDYSQNLLDIARQRIMGAQRNAAFYQADLLQDTWASLDMGSFDWIFIRAVLHHIPAFAQRVRILEQAAGRLASGGKLVMANWQFMDIPRLRKRILPWEEIGLSDVDVESGDYLLDWQRDGHGLRYVHLVDEAESQELASHSGLALDSLYYADGHTNRLTLYAILSQPQSPLPR